jgi:hypothetical protein
MNSRRRENVWFFEIGTDYYKLGGGDGPVVRTFVFELGPIKWRFFMSRIGKGLYFASKKFILDDLLAAQAEKTESSEPSAVRHDPVGHAMVRIRPENWHKVVPDYRLGWAENAREAVVNNLGPLSNAARAYAATHPVNVVENPAKSLEAILSDASRLYGMEFLSPVGEYILAEDGKSIAHSVYGSLLDPRQPIEDQAAPQDAVWQSFKGATAELTFLEDGLHAVLTIEKE